jgi:hypothetical protein
MPSVSLPIPSERQWKGVFCVGTGHQGLVLHGTHGADCQSRKIDGCTIHGPSHQTHGI